MKSAINILIMFIFNFPVFEALAKEIGELPVAVSNNAVAAAKTRSGWQLFSFNGLTQNKDWRAVSNICDGLQP